MKPRGALGAPSAFLLACAAAALAAPVPAAGQAARDPHGGCFPPRPFPECRSFFVFEVQGAFPVAQSEATAHFDWGSYRVRDFETMIEWNVGYMVNVGEAAAVGGVFTLGSGGGDPLTGLRARGRWWAARDLALEIEGGVVRSGAAGSHPDGVLGPTVDARLVLHDVGHVFVRWDELNIDEPDGRPGPSDRTSHAALVGFGLDGQAAVWGTGAVGLATAVWMALFIAALGDT